LTDHDVFREERGDGRKGENGVTENDVGEGYENAAEQNGGEGSDAHVVV
jgi:hypothetical protein